MGSERVPHPSQGRGWEPEPLYVPAGDANDRGPSDQPTDNESKEDVPGSHVIVIDVS